MKQKRPRLLRGNFPIVLHDNKIYMYFPKLKKKYDYSIITKSFNAYAFGSAYLSPYEIFYLLKILLWC